MGFYEEKSHGPQRFGERNPTSVAGVVFYLHLHCD